MYSVCKPHIQDHTMLLWLLLFCHLKDLLLTPRTLTNAPWISFWIGLFPLQLFLMFESKFTFWIRVLFLLFSDHHFYDESKPFTCLDGSATIAFDRVNDDYCDCKDGSDEPGKWGLPFRGFPPLRTPCPCQKALLPHKYSNWVHHLSIFFWEEFFNGRNFLIHINPLRCSAMQ